MQTYILMAIIAFILLFSVGAYLGYRATQRGVKDKRSDETTVTPAPGDLPD